MSNLTPEQHIRLELVKVFGADWGPDSALENIVPSMQALIAWVITGETAIPTIEPNPDTDPELKDLSGQVTETAGAAHADKPEGPGWVHVSESFPDAPTRMKVEYFYVGNDVIWRRIAPPELPEGWKLYDFSGEAPKDYGGEVLFWDGSIRADQLASNWHWEKLLYADQYLASGNYAAIIYAYRPKVTEGPTDSEIETECGDDTPEAQDAPVADALDAFDSVVQRRITK